MAKLTDITNEQVYMYNIYFVGPDTPVCCVRVVSKLAIISFHVTLWVVGIKDAKHNE